MTLRFIINDRTLEINDEGKITVIRLTSLSKWPGNQSFVAWVEGGVDKEELIKALASNQ